MKKNNLTLLAGISGQSIACKGMTALLIAAITIAPDIYAEKADRKKEIEIDAAKQKIDLASNVLILEGNVVLTQGTMRINADKMIVKRDEQEQVFAELFGVNGNQISFREKREGLNDFMEGTADRAEFDDRASTVKLFSRARLKNGNDVLSGDYIYYNSVTEVMLADGRAPDTKQGKDGKSLAAIDTVGRVRIVIQPRIDPQSKAATSALPKSPVTSQSPSEKK
ncbi:MAG: lipopolysaccharide transport periplasmic protein LptA [Pseudomonadota bacterium]